MSSRRCGDTGAPPIVVYDVASETRTERIALADLAGVSQRARVIAVTPAESFDRIPALLDAGACGIVGRNAASEELVRAVLEVADGHVFVSRLMLRQIVEHVARSAGRSRPVRVHGEELLAPRERDVVALLMRGMTNREIAANMHLSEATVKAHLGRVMSKWQVRDRLQVALHALDRGTIRS